ncbi:MAG: hypothetical protein Q7R67_02790, partial [bacterium]|nr:hypothetical protein [bacterium]
MKIVSTGSTLSSPQFLEKRLRARRRSQRWWAIGALTLLIIVIVVSRQEKLLIADVTVEGARVVKEEDVVAMAKQILAGNYLGLMPKRNALIYPGQKVEETLLKEFPRFSAVAASLEGLRLLRIDVAEREPFALYCASVLNPEEAGECFFLDDQGFIFDQSPLFSGAVYFIYTFKPTLEEPLGKQFLPTADFGVLAQFIENLPVLGIEPLAVEVGVEEFTIILAHEARMRIGRLSNLNLIYSNLSAFLGDEVITAQVDFIQKISELDLRTENKVFYKFRE